jgi:hypothetical protein
MISLTIVRLALCKGVVILNRFCVQSDTLLSSGLETVREFTVRDSALGRSRMRIGFTYVTL